MTPYFPPSLSRYEPTQPGFSTWTDHIPFGYDLVAELRPRLLVELGTQRGASYFAFCQAIADHEIPCLSYAVDTWMGDEHTKEYGEDIFNKVRDYNREKFRGFSYLMRMLFDEALTHFGDESVDLLHIDGCHSYAAVQNDFEKWYPKVAPGGIIFFHDIASRMLDFGVWKYWAELEKTHTTFAFRHGFGLGVLCKPGGNRTPSPLLGMLFDSSEEHEKLRSFYVAVARNLEARRKVAKIEAQQQQKVAATGSRGITPPPAAS